MKIAVASLNGQTVCGQPGRCRTFILFDTDGFEVLEREVIEFSANYVLQGFSPDKAHPIDKIDVVIASAIGEGLVNLLQQRDVIAVATSVKNAEEAAQRFLALAHHLGALLFKVHAWIDREGEAHATTHVRRAALGWVHLQLVAIE